MRMLDLGAELPLFGPKSLGHGYDIGLMSNIALTLNIAGCPDLAEGLPNSCFLPPSESG